jgi:AraC family transcriptional regulator
MPSTTFFEAKESALSTAVPADFSSSDIRQPSEWHIRDHRHQFIVHLKGQMNRLETDLEGHGGSFGPAVPGEIWSIPAGRNYASFMQGDMIRYAIFYLEVPSCCSFDVVPLAGVYDPFLYRTAIQLETVSDQQTDVAEMLARSLYRSVNSYLQRVYGRDKIGQEKSVHRPLLLPSMIRRLREYIYENLAERITLASLTGITGMTEHHLLIAFRQAFGLTPWQYVITQRLRCAQRMLVGTRKDITEIALEAGFSSHSHLTSLFTKRVGCPPSEFRERVG